MGESVFICVIMIFCSMIFTGIGIFSAKKKKPMHFWSGSVVEESEITDVKAYNMANSKLWIGYSSLYWLSAVFALINGVISVILIIVASTIGLIILIAIYVCVIQKKYFVKY